MNDKNSNNDITIKASSEDNPPNIIELELPWYKHLSIKIKKYDGGLEMLHLRFREGRRYTDIELTSDDAIKLRDVLSNFADSNKL